MDDLQPALLLLIVSRLILEKPKFSKEERP
jgi:hypothetical protein